NSLVQRFRGLFCWDQIWKDETVRKSLAQKILGGQPRRSFCRVGHGLFYFAELHSPSPMAMVWHYGDHCRRRDLWGPHRVIVQKEYFHQRFWQRLARPWGVYGPL